MAMLSNGAAQSIDTYPLRLAVQPKCGTLGSSQFNNFNTGINLRRIKTIYGFGDSYMSNGQHIGSHPPPAVHDPSSPKYGQRASNGLVWIEQFGHQIGALVKDYAAGGASVSSALSPTDTQQTDMIGHVQTFLGQHNHIDTDSSMVLISYGINDWASASRRGAKLSSSALELLRQTERLVQAGFRNLVILSPPMISEPLTEFNNIIWTGLKAFKTKNPSIQFAYVDFTTLYSTITAAPRAFGYQSTGSCLKSATSAAGACRNPDRYLYYLPNHPQKLTHGLMAKWAISVLSNCRS
ncbi:uncharacterized protein MELLADRAFT_110168 [Melampsora larici-populina 98AG31]|uniref:Carbohydrate esterase family 16 protein n=1 Tax=Melampsora larici-populina (strain 98AG31 / pathotype 3-4-7) TaxID=747676 RepID=F4RYW8_MELLP|nr:uncharacterized protein MELLADRAFT_110168 [Melampsora larici-populina 98AG31]EGG02432.1 hypothetical protein MELLADRAFT_110168 [Melampsora larici-populina 98AG31]